MKHKLHKNGAFCTMEKLPTSGRYLIECRKPNGELYDKIRCDDYRNALEYWRSFNQVVKWI